MLREQGIEKSMVAINPKREAVIAHDFSACGLSQPGRGCGFVRRAWDTLSLYMVENIQFYARVLEGREGEENDHDQSNASIESRQGG